MTRGGELRQRILFSAKDVFLELGFERASMDTIAARAQTTKRTLYAHFENKERLFIAVVDLLADLFGEKLESPSSYADDPVEALALFCGRFQKIMTWSPAVRVFRLFTGEAERFPEGAARAYQAIFGTVHERMAEFLRTRFGQPRKRAAQIADQMVSRALYPRIIRSLFGIDPISEEWLDDAVVDPAFDPTPVRAFLTQIVGHPDEVAR